MGLKEFAKSVVTLFKVSSKPTREEFSLLVKVVIIGIGLIGAISFLVRFVLLAIQGA
jgi:protein translocase SEC61 complex gamma subunit